LSEDFPGLKKLELFVIRLANVLLLSRERRNQVPRELNFHTPLVGCSSVILIQPSPCSYSL